MTQREPHPRVIATLDKLDSVNWFGRVGIAEFEKVVQLNSWEEAIQSASSKEWEDMTLEMANQLREKILEADEERFQSWNEIAAAVKKYSNALVSDKISMIMAATPLGKLFLDCVQWDIMHLCMEAEFADILEPGFYHSLAFYYVKGHFPCGISGPDLGSAQIIY